MTPFSLKVYYNNYTRNGTRGLSVHYDIRKYRMYGLINGYGPLAFASMALRGRRTKKYDLGKSKITGKKRI